LSFYIVVASYSETLERIYNLRGGEIDLRLDRVERALSLFDHPEKKFPSFHVAGTNGKGSTAAMLHRILTLGGYRAALYTSPHLVSFTERMRIGDSEISPDEVTELAEEVRVRTAAVDVPLTFFETITVMAFVYFARQKIEVAVVEVGLGGRLDATNLVAPLVSVITTISKDHEAYLGADLLSIAREKGGIIKHGIPVVVGAVSDDVAGVLRDIATEHGSNAYFLGRDFRIFLKNTGVFDYTGIKQDYVSLSLALRGRHQTNNAAIALAALELSSKVFAVSGDVVRAGLRTVLWPGRFEIVRKTPTVILDGAHNGEGVAALAEEVEQYRQGRAIKLLFASMEDKDWRLMLSTLARLADEVVLTRVAMERSADPKLLAAQLSDTIRHRVIEDPGQGLKFLLDKSGPRDLILVTGSLYLLGQILPALPDTVDATRAGSNPLHPQS
jgi:dihydrofolate synthase / folylpolyglutamate synthase